MTSPFAVERSTDRQGKRAAGRQQPAPALGHGAAAAATVASVSPLRVDLSRDAEAVEKRASAASLQRVPSFVARGRVKRRFVMLATEILRTVRRQCEEAAAFAAQVATQQERQRSIEASELLREQRLQQQQQRAVQAQPTSADSTVQSDTQLAELAVQASPLFTHAEAQSEVRSQADLAVQARPYAVDATAQSEAHGRSEATAQSDTATLTELAVQAQPLQSDSLTQHTVSLSDSVTQHSIMLTDGGMQTDKHADILTADVVAAKLLSPAALERIVREELSRPATDRSADSSALLVKRWRAAIFLVAQHMPSLSARAVVVTRVRCWGLRLFCGVPDEVIPAAVQSPL